MRMALLAFALQVSAERNRARRFVLSPSSDHQKLWRTPKPEDLRLWVNYFKSTMGGGMYYKEANEKAFKLLAGSHPELDDLRLWVNYFKSNMGGGMYYKEANEKAFKLLSGSPPKLEDLKVKVEYFKSRQGGGLSYADANEKALKLLAEEDDNKGANNDGDAGANNNGVQDDPVETTTTTTELVLDCALPAKPQGGDPFGQICRERGNVVRHGKTCSPVCGISLIPIPPLLHCQNGTIGSFECRMNPLQEACKTQCAKDGKGYKFEMNGNGPKCTCL